MYFYIIQNDNGLKATIASKGGRLVSLAVPDKQGFPVDVVYGFDKIEDTKHIVDLANVEWEAKQPDQHKLELNYFAKTTEGDSLENFYIKLVYSLNNQNCLTITCEASSAKQLFIKHPGYISFNLNGNNDDSILKHQLLIKADSFLPAATAQNPAADAESVTGTPFDFRNSSSIGVRINDHHAQLKIGNGYCHCYLLNKHASRTPVAKLKGDKTGIIMEVFTDQPKLHFCTGSVNQHPYAPNGGKKKNYHIGLSLLTGDLYETQHPQLLPLIAMEPQEVYRAVCGYRFKS